MRTQGDFSESEVQYLLYDGRYTKNPDRAIVYEVCDTITEAGKNAPSYGDDTVVVACNVVDGQLIASSSFAFRYLPNGKRKWYALR